jgi:cation transport ATPase
MRHHLREAVFAAVLALLALALALATPRLTGSLDPAQPYYSRASFFPWLGLALVLSFGLWSAVRALRGIRRELSDEIEAEHTSAKLALGGAALFGLYALLCAALGYAASTFVAMLLLGAWAGLSRRLNLLLAAGVTAALVLIFVVGFRVWFAPSWLTGWLA